jgi:sulfofructose kinase
MLRFEAMRIPFAVPATRGAAPFDVVGLGLNSVDLLAVVADFPASNTKQPLQRYARMAGGQIATALVACARLGWRTSYLGSFGGDEPGTLARDSLVAEGVDISRARIVAGATNQFAVILVDARTGNRTVLWHRHPDLDMDPSAVPADAVTSGRILIVDCYETAASTAAARFARQAGIPTVVDVERVRPGIDALLQQIDAIIAAEEFPPALTGHADLGRALEAMGREFSAPLVCVTLGEHGSLARCNGREIRTPGYQVDCVDSTGAGDVFRGAFAAGCLRAPDGQLEDVLCYANAVAALNCRRLGARGGIAGPDDVERFMSAHSHGSRV